MDIDIDVTDVVLLNEEGNKATISIDFSGIWPVIENNYTTLYVAIYLELPTKEATLTETVLSRVIELEEIVDQKYAFEINYPGDLDETRSIKASATVLGYTVIPVI